MIAGYLDIRRVANDS